MPTHGSSARYPGNELAGLSHRTDAAITAHPAAVRHSHTQGLIFIRGVTTATMPPNKNSQYRVGRK